LLRGACHRARIRATRWLAMTGKASAYWFPAFAGLAAEDGGTALATLEMPAPKPTT